MNTLITSLIDPVKVWSRQEVLATPCPIMKLPGVHAWFFKEIPPHINTDGCVKFKDLYILYVGITPGSPETPGKPFIGRTLYNRIPYHFDGTASGSTLRLTLGCLLAENLAIELRRVGSGKRKTFGPGEKKLSEWMGDNAFVKWVYYHDPWKLEQELLSNLCLPLNLHLNAENSNYQVVSEIRNKAKSNARKLPIVSGRHR